MFLLDKTSDHIGWATGSLHEMKQVASNERLMAPCNLDT
jgi:hypothetical protein